MKLSYFGDFAFAGSIKKGTFVINSGSADPSLLFNIFTKEDRDISLRGNLLTWPGEYEYGGVGVNLFLLPNKNLGAKIFTEDGRVLFLPLLDKELTEQEMEVFGDIDVLVVETGETNTFLKKMVEEIDPKAVLPVGAGTEKFLVQMGATQVDTTEEYIVDASSLPPDKTVFVKLLPAQ